MRTPTLALGLSGLLVMGLSAQTRTVISPKAFASSDAPSASFYPLSRVSNNQTYRQLHILEVHDLGSTTVGKITGISYRRDGRIYAGQKSPACWIDLKVAISTAKTTSQTISTTFANNEGTDKVVVVARKKINFASYPFIGKSGQVQPFLIQVPFDTAKLLVFKGGSIAVDVFSYDNNLYNATTRTYRYLYLDRAYNSTYSSTSRSGRACYSSNKSNYLPFYGSAYGYFYKTTGKLRLNGYSYYGLTGGAGLMLMSAGKLPTAVPFPGACYLHIDPSKIFLTLPGSGVGYGGRKMTTYYYPPYKGTQMQYFEIPWQSSFAGARIYAQMIGIDPLANSLGLTMTNLIDISLPAYRASGLPLSYTYTYGTYIGRTYGFGPYKSQGAVTAFKLN